MLRKTAILMALLAATAMAGCSSRRGEQRSDADYPYVGPPDEGTRYTSAGPRMVRDPDGASITHAYRSGDADYYGRLAYAYGRDPSYDYYLASDDGYGYDEDFPVEYAYFHDELDPYGRWYEDGRYGWVWSPEYVTAGWRPYLDGYWVYTDWGWTWISDDPWGADTYHYGRWDCDASNRWVWIPDDVWAPAWVSWRYGDGWAGWAPLPPEASWGVTLGLRYTDNLVLPSRWCFVPESRLTSTRLRTYVAPLPEARRIYSQTRDVTRYAVVNGRPAERGLRPALIERRTGRDIPEYRLVTRARGQNKDRVQGRTLVAPMPLNGRGMARASSRESVERGRSEPIDRMQRDRGQERQLQIQRDRAERRQLQMRDRTDRENRARAAQAREGRVQAQQRVEQARYERLQRQQQAQQARYDRQQRQQQAQQARYDRQQRQQQAQQGRYDRQRQQQAQQAEQARYERQQQADQARAQRQQQQEQQQQQRRQPEARGRQDRGGNDDTGTQGSDQRSDSRGGGGRGRGRGHDR